MTFRIPTTYRRLLLLPLPLLHGCTILRTLLRLATILAPRHAAGSMHFCALHTCIAIQYARCHTATPHRPYTSHFAVLVTHHAPLPPRTGLKFTPPLLHSTALPCLPAYRDVRATTTVPHLPHTAYHTLLYGPHGHPAVPLRFMPDTCRFPLRICRVTGHSCCYTRVTHTTHTSHLHLLQLPACT